MKKLFLIIACVVTQLCFANTPLPESIMAYWFEAENLLKEGQFAKAVDAYTCAIEVAEYYHSENHYDIYVDRANALAHLDYPEEAINDYLVVLKQTKLTDPLWEKHVARALKGSKKIQLKSSRNTFFDKRDFAYYLIEYSEKDIQNERDAANRALDAMSDHLYDMGREAMNFNAGDAAHHGIQAGTSAWDAWEHSREANRMERENSEESLGTLGKPGDSRD